MPKQQTDNLVQLINSLTKGEKRSFSLFVNRNNAQSEKLFMKVFELIAKNGYYDESLILEKIPRIKKIQLSNIKRNLYDQILLCLRNLNKSKNVDLIIQECIDYSRILYNKGLYKASLDLLERAKKISSQHERYYQLMQVIDFERMIESQHITGSMFGRAEDISSFSNKVIGRLSDHNALANFSLTLYGFYLQYGYVKDKKDYRFVSEYFHGHHPEVTLNKLGFYDRILYHQSYVWFYNMTQDFAAYYRHALSWVENFHEAPEKMETDTPLYLKGLHNVLNALFMSQRYDKFLPVFIELSELLKNPKLVKSENTQGLWTLFYYVHGINEIYLTANYAEGARCLKPLEELLVSNLYNWDLHRLLVFYYKIACVFFGNAQHDEAISYLNKITNYVYPDFRNDIQCFARILNLIAHFELGNNLLVSYQVKSVYRFLSKMEDLQEVQKEIFKFLRKTPRMLEKDLPREFLSLKNKLIQHQKDQYERRPFLYLDIISWLESKIEKISMQEAIVKRQGLPDPSTQPLLLNGAIAKLA